MKYLHKFCECNDINKKCYDMLPIKFALIAIGGSFSARVKEKRASIDGEEEPIKRNSNDEHIDDRRLTICGN